MSNKNRKVTGWKSFHHDGCKYDLSHLDPFDWVVECEQKVGGPIVTYKFHVNFSHHTFTSSEKRNTNGIPYETDFNDSRVFDHQRYELSKKLPGIIQDLNNRRCFLTSHNNYFTVEILDENSVKRDYEVYFAVSRTDHKGWMRLVVESAYLRDADKVTARTNGRKINFNVIARNTLEKKGFNRRRK